ncbi:MAG: tetratricopeptide repeat protein [Deltaproteobacteria bacterium]|nr:tetratricopeptide repeat protein [Deltaproteobacteria bacterium]
MAATLVYLPALHGGFVNWDDPSYVTQNHHIRTSGFAFLRWALVAFHGENWCPATWISHHLDYRLWGLDPFGHHLTSVLLHAANSVLVALLAVRLVELAGATDRNPAGAAGRPAGRYGLLTGAITGILFAVHPIHVESVAWVAERKDVLCAFFYLLTLLVYLGGFGANPTHLEAGDTAAPATASSSRRRLRYAMCLTLFLLAIASKPMAISLPLLLLILDAYPLRRLRLGDPSWRDRTRILVWEKIPFFALSILSGVLTLAAQKAGHAVYSLDEYALSARLSVSVHAVTAYLGKILLPLELVPFYPFPDDPSLTSAQFAIPALLVIAVTVGALLTVRRHPVWLAAWAAYIALLFPTLGIVKVGRQAMADRYAYLPSIVALLLVGLACATLLQQFRSRPLGRIRAAAAATALALGVAALCAKTTVQIRVWADGVSLWTAVCRDNPRDQRIAFAQMNLGDAYFKSSLHGEALDAYQEALRLDPDVAGVFNNIGNAYVGLGNLDQAVTAYEKAIEILFADINAHVNLGNAYDMQDRTSEAQTEYRTALSLDPDNAKAHYNLGIVYDRIGSHVAAIREYREALRLAPGYERAQDRLDRAMEGLPPPRE